jgi:hypothetical protein
MAEAKRISVRAPSVAQIYEATRDHVVLTWSNVACAVFKRETTLGGVRSIQSAYDALASRNPEGVYMVTIVEDRAPLPVVEVRDALAKFLASGAGRTKMSAVIQEGVGFRAAAVRGVVTGLAMVARLPYPHKVFGTPTEAARWFAANADKPLDAKALVAALEDARLRALTLPGSSTSQGV